MKIMSTILLLSILLLANANHCLAAGILDTITNSQTTAAEAAQGGAPDIYVKSGLVYNTGGLGLNVRVKPWGRVIGGLRDGNQIIITGESGNWYIIDYYGKTAYVHKNYIKVTGGLGERPESPKQKPGGRREPDPVSLRFNQSEITAVSPQFDGWFEHAINANGNLQRKPYVENRYGKEVTSERVLKTIMWIESRGNHTKNGKVIENAWGFTGFMQLGRHFGEGRFDPKQNLTMGARFLNDSCFRSSTPPPGKFRGQVYHPSDSPDDMLIKGMVGYNRGPYATTDILRNAGRISPPVVGLDRPWSEVVAKTPTSGHSYMQEGVYYGLMSKAGLGLDFTAQEKNWIKKFRRIKSDQAFEAWRDRQYGSIRAL